MSRYDEECKAIELVKAFDHDTNAFTCEHCGHDLYCGCPICAASELSTLRARLATAEQALADLGVTPEEARAGVKRSREKDRRLAEMTERARKLGEAVK